MEIVVNRCFGGFGLSPKAILRYAELKGFKLYGYIEDKDCDKPFLLKDLIRYNNSNKNAWVIYWLKTDLGDRVLHDKFNDAEWFHERDIPRNDKDLVKVVKELKKEVNSRFSDLKVVKIPNDVEWEIDEYDGLESIEEKHRSW